MHVAIVNNASSTPDNIIRLLGENSHEVFDYSQADKIDSTRFDLLILTGGSQFPIVSNIDKLQTEIDLIQNSAIPLLGICYGCELITVAFGGTLKDRGDHTQTREALEITVLKDDPIFLGHTTFMAYDAHRWIVDQVPMTLDILAQSVHGPEVVRHKERPIYGFQFHPERMLDETLGNEIFDAFVRQYVVQ